MSGKSVEEHLFASVLKYAILDRTLFADSVGHDSAEGKFAIDGIAAIKNLFMHRSESLSGSSQFAIKAAFWHAECYLQSLIDALNNESTEIDYYKKLKQDIHDYRLAHWGKMNSELMDEGDHQKIDVLAELKKSSPSK